MVSLNPVPKRQVASERKTVLVVDDEPMILDFVRSVLERAGFDVVTSNSAPEALGVIRSCESPVDVLLTDVQMPEMNGVELVRRLTNYRTNVAIAFMTGFIADSRLPSNIPVVRKPFRAADLVTQIGELLNTCS
jgi:CheY-like chemotaxis protein